MFCKALASSAKEYQVPAIIYFWLVSPLGRYVFIDIITTLLEKKIWLDLNLFKISYCFISDTFIGWQMYQVLGYLP